MPEHGRLWLRPPGVADEAVVRTAQRELDAKGFRFAYLGPDGGWADYLASTEAEAAGRDLTPGRVAGLLLLAVVDGQVVGRVSVRFRLTDRLLAHGGHIGYAVRPGFRRRGYAGEMLRQALVVARAHGVQPVLLTCDDDNLVSATVIERAGGHRDPEWPVSENAGGPPVRRYWVG